jgi:hypothetical protein
MTGAYDAPVPPCDVAGLYASGSVARAAGTGAQAWPALTSPPIVHVPNVMGSKLLSIFARPILPGVPECP